MLPRAALGDLVKGLTNRTPTIWEGEPEPFLAVKNGKAGKYFVLDIVSYRGKGADEYRSGPSATNPNVLSSSINGVRYFVMSVKAISFDSFCPSYDMLEQLRLRLWSVSARAIYMQEGLALADLPGGITVLRMVADNRQVSCSTMDISFGYASVEQALDDDGGTIATAPIQSGDLQ